MTIPRQTILFLALVLILSSPNHAKDLFALDSICKGIDNAGNCAEAIEKKQLPKYKDAITRTDSNTIKIKATEGKTIVLKNFSDPDGDNWYYFRDFIPEINQFLFRVQLGEGNYYLLVNKRDGNQTKIDDLPVISPGCDEFITCSEDLDANYNPNRMQIWKLYNGQSILTQTLDMAPSDAKWVNSNTIKFTEHIWQGEEKEGKKLPRVLDRIDDKWRIRGGKAGAKGNVKK